MSEVVENLEYFVVHFVKEFENKLEFFHRILEHEVKKSGKTAKILVNTSQDLGASLFGAIGFFLGCPSIGAKVGGKIVKKSAELLENYISEKYSERVANLVDFVEYSQKKKTTECRRELVKAGVDVFQSFELQFMRVTTKQSKKDALHYFATDAVSRALNYKLAHKETSISESVLLGESKKIDIHSTSPGFPISYIDSKGKLIAWKTSSLFEKAGIVTEEGNFKYFANRNSETSKYGYRRLLQEEVCDTLNMKYKEEPPNTRFEVDKFEIEREDLDKLSETILKQINKHDEKLSEERIRSFIEEVKFGVINEIEELKTICTDEHKETMKLLLNMEKNFRSINFDDFLKTILKSLEEAKEERQKILTSVENARNESKENYGKLTSQFTSQSIDDQERHMETVSLIKTAIEIEKEISDKLSKHCCMNQERNNKAVRFNIQEPVPFFTGREKELRDIHEALESKHGQAIISQSTSITGLGGIGKSELARKFASEYKETYINAIWINAETTNSLKTSFQELARELQIPIVHNTDKQERAIQEIVKEVFQYFENMETLFIFDNVEECTSVGEFLSIFLQFSSNSLYVLITSRNQNWELGQEGDILVVTLNEFSADEALDFVKKFLGIKDDKEDKTIDDLTETLWYFPLALKQAVSYIKQQQKKASKFTTSSKYSIINYLKEFAEKPDYILNKGHYDKLDRYTKTLMQTWEVTMRKIAEDSDLGEIAMYYFDFISYLYPDNIRIETYFSTDTPVEQQRDAISLLDDYSMINLHEGVLSVHRLVQYVNRLKLIISGREEYILSDIIEIVKNTGDVTHIGSVIGHAVTGGYKNLVEEFNGQMSHLSLNNFRQRSHVYAFSPQFGFAIPDNFSDTGMLKSRFRNLGYMGSGF